MACSLKTNRVERMAPKHVHRGGEGGDRCTPPQCVTSPLASPPHPLLSRASSPPYSIPSHVGPRVSSHPLFTRTHTHTHTHIATTHHHNCHPGVVITYCQDKKFHLGELLNGAFAGLAAVTPASGFISPWAAFVIGIIGGLASFGSIWLFKKTLRLDDVLDVTSLQGAPGIVGSILVGVFADKRVSGGGLDGLIMGGGTELLKWQCVGVVVATVWSGFWTFVIMKLMAVTVGIDVRWFRLTRLEYRGPS